VNQLSKFRVVLTVKKITSSSPGVPLNALLRVMELWGEVKGGNIEARKAEMTAWSTFLGKGNETCPNQLGVRGLGCCKLPKGSAWDCIPPTLQLLSIYYS